MTLGDVMSGKHRPQLVEAIVMMRAMDRDGTAVARNSRNTKLLELRLRAWLTEEGTRQIELART
jgi:hypothetical protein